MYLPYRYVWNFLGLKHTNRLSFDSGVVIFHIGQGLAGIGDGLATLDEGGA